jgi:hypothetical protein
MQNSELFPMLGAVSMVALMVWAIIEWRRSKHKFDLHNKLLDKFSSSQELNGFLSSRGGNKFLDFLTIGSLRPKEKLLGSISKGIIFLFLGIAIFFVGPFMSHQAEESNGLQAFGILTMVLGAGFLVSTFISYKLSKKWGIIDTERTEQSE